MKTPTPATLLCLLLLLGCSAGRHASTPSRLGVPSRASAVLASADAPGPLTVITLDSADWKVDRSGLINLKDPRAKAAGLKDGKEPIHIYFHALRHPTRGLFIIDTGVETAFRDDPRHALTHGTLVSSFLSLDAVPMPLGAWLKAQPTPLQGVFFTHLHLDHIMGLRDVPAGVPLYAGPGELASRSLMNAFTCGITDSAFAGRAPLQTWQFAADPDGRFAGVVDIFGDGSLFALWMPGHTPGSVAYLARTPSGPVLFTGDVSHTQWGWDHAVEPGTFTEDPARNLQSLVALKTLVAEHPRMQVRLGHQ